jgi:hypothetical protein
MNPERDRPASIPEPGTHSNLRLTVLSEVRTKAQAGCYAGGTTPLQSGPRPCMPGLDVTPLPPTVIFSPFTQTHNRSSLSLKARCSQVPCSNLCESLRDLALKSVRKLEKILLLYSCALGEALAALCVHYSWSLAPRRLAVTL